MWTDNITNNNNNNYNNTINISNSNSSNNSSYIVNSIKFPQQSISQSPSLSSNQQPNKMIVLSGTSTPSSMGSIGGSPSLMGSKPRGISPPFGSINGFNENINTSSGGAGFKIFSGERNTTTNNNNNNNNNNNTTGNNNKSPSFSNFSPYNGSGQSNLTSSLERSPLNISSSYNQSSSNNFYSQLHQNQGYYQLLLNTNLSINNLAPRYHLSKETPQLLCIQNSISPLDPQQIQRLHSQILQQQQQQQEQQRQISNNNNNNNNNPFDTKSSFKNNNNQDAIDQILSYQQHNNNSSNNNNKKPTNFNGSPSIKGQPVKSGSDSQPKANQCKTPDCIVCERGPPPSFEKGTPIWSQILHVVLYALTESSKMSSQFSQLNRPNRSEMPNGKKYFHLRDDIYEFINIHWDVICRRERIPHWKHTIGMTLSHYQNLFKNGYQIFHNTGYWCLKDENSNPYEIDENEVKKRKVTKNDISAAAYLKKQIQSQQSQQSQQSPQQQSSQPLSISLQSIPTGM